MWDRMHDLISKTRVDLFLRHGDQVYADSAFLRGRDIYQRAGLDEAERFAQVTVYIQPHIAI